MFAVNVKLETLFSLRYLTLDFFVFTNVEHFSECQGSKNDYHQTQESTGEPKGKKMNIHSQFFVGVPKRYYL